MPIRSSTENTAAYREIKKDLAVMPAGRKGVKGDTGKRARWTKVVQSLREGSHTLRDVALCAKKQDQIRRQRKDAGRETNRKRRGGHRRTRGGKLDKRYVNKT